MTEKHSDIPRSSSSSPSEGSSRCSTPDPLDIAAYNDLMTARLPIIPPVKTIEELVQAQPSRSSLAANGTCTRIAQPEDEDGDAGMIDGRPMTKAEKQNAKKKRRKEREKAMKEQEAKEREEEVERERQRVKRAEAEKVAIPFRLFSCHPIQPIKLIPKQDYPTTANPLSVSYTPTQAERRRQQAIEAAFDTSSLSCPVPVSVSGSAAGPSRRPLPTYTPRQPLPPAPPLPAHGAPTTSTRTKVAGGATLELTPMGALSGGGGGGAVVGPAMMVLLTEKDRPRRITRCKLNSTDEGAVVSKHLQVHGQGLIEPHAELSKRKQQAMEVFPRIVLPRTKGLARRIPWVEMTLRDHHSSIPQIGEDISLELSPTTSLQGPAITLPVHVKAPDQPSETPKEAPEKQEALPRAPSRPLGKSRRRARTLARRLVLSSTTPTAFVQTKNSAHTDIAGGRTKEFKRVPPRFWAPEVGIGGKARGYAWGYRDSREIRGGGVEGEGDGEGKGWVRGAYVRSKDR